jgi:hypothetical protein
LLSVGENFNGMGFAPIRWRAGTLSTINFFKEEG